MTSPESWPPDNPGQLADRLAEHDVSDDEIADAIGVMARLKEWVAPMPTEEDTARLLAVLAPLVGVPATAPAASGWSSRWRALKWMWKVVARQPRVVHRSIWAASGIAMMGAALYAALAPGVRGPASLGVFLPAIAAGGAAFLYGREADAGYEVTRATPVAPQLVIVSRLVALLAYDTALALGATVLVAALHGTDLRMVAALWAGPMALLATGSLLASLMLGPIVAVAGALALWLAQFTQITSGQHLDAATGPAWQTNPAIFIAAAVLLVIALAYAPTRERSR